MSHNVDLVTTIAVSFGLAMVLGFAAARLRMPPMIGYLLAGVLIGPFTHAVVDLNQLVVWAPRYPVRRATNAKRVS